MSTELAAMAATHSLRFERCVGDPARFYAHRKGRSTSPQTGVRHLDRRACAGKIARMTWIAKMVENLFVEHCLSIRRISGRVIHGIGIKPRDAMRNLSLLVESH